MTNFTVFHTACKLSVPKVIKIKIVCYSITSSVSVVNWSWSPKDILGKSILHDRH